jgi:GH15 family glucan-1,4-alpha-glucosidase
MTTDVTSNCLSHNGFVMRHGEADDFGEPGSTFLARTLWYIETLASVGRRDEALVLFENIPTPCDHLGLPPEDIAPDTGILWGDFPRTYSQAGLISAAMRLSRSWEEGMWHAS